MKKMITITLMCLCCFITACSCISEPVTSSGDIASPTEVVSSTEESEEGRKLLTVEEIFAIKGNLEILESVGITEIKEAVIEEVYEDFWGGGYSIRIVDANDNIYYIGCNGRGAIEVIQRNSLEGETIFYILP